MVKKTCTAEQIISKLREVAVLISQGTSISESKQEGRGNGADLLPLVKGIRWDAGGTGEEV